MSMPSKPASASNLILSALSSEDSRRLIPQGERVHLNVGEVLYEARQPIQNVYFMLNGMTSIVTPMQDGSSIEVMIVGHEGMVGLPALESPNHSVPTTAFIQVAGQAIKINAAIVREEFKRGGALQLGLTRYLQFGLVQVSQCAACNRLHELEERLARWLLMVHDRMDSTKFLLTHDFLAQMLGTRRSSVTLAAGALQRAGLIQYRRGELEIVNREELEQASCECYANIKESWDLLLNHHAH